MSQPLVTFIIPMYNVERFIKKGLDSISAQTYTNLEIIAVNDGSPDASGRIADGCAQADSRITVIHKENGGVSSARNAGLAKATGEYIIFVDGDDHITPDYVDYMLRLINETNADMAVSLNFFTHLDMTQIKDDHVEIYSGARATISMYMNSIGVACWNKIYRRQFIEKNNLSFLPELWFGEGMTFNIMAFQKANCIGVGRRKIYHFAYNIESATRKFNIASWQCGFRALEIQKEYLDTSNKQVISAWRYHYGMGGFNTYHEAMKAGRASEYCAELKKCKKRIRAHVLAAWSVPCSLKKKLLALAVFISPKLTHVLLQWRMRRKEGGNHPRTNSPS